MTTSWRGSSRTLLSQTWIVVELVILLAALAWLVSGLLWTLIVWEVLALGYLVIGMVLLWRGSTESVGSPATARRLARLSWIAPLTSGVVGAFSAVRALASPDPSSASAGSVALAVAASLGVVISWAMLNSGFAEVYQHLHESRGDVASIAFDGEDTDAFLNYLYFAFSIGAGFVTSDAVVRTLAVRRVVLLHGIASFLFNALLIATALEVFQRLVA